MARKKSTKKISPVVQQYNRERGRIQRQINRMRQRGYMGMEDMLPPKPKKITAGSVRRLKKITTKDLYDKADFVDLTTGEVIATGTEARAEERRASARKAAQTRARKRRQRVQSQQEEQPTYADEVQQAIENNREEMENRWRQQREQADAENRRRMEEEQEYARQFASGEIMRDHVMSVLDSMRQEWPSTVSSIEELIDNAEGDEGYDRFWDRMAEQPEFLDSLEQVFYKSGDHISPTAFNNVRRVILNRAMSAQESREAQDTFERDQYSAFDIDEEP